MRKIKIRFIHFYVSLFTANALLVAVILAVGPTAFQKSVTIKKIDADRFSSELSSNGNALNVADFLASIPYQDKANMVWHPDPGEKYRRTIIQGDGNCSNLVFGASYYLLEQKIDFSIIHLMERDGFLQGSGHTVISLPYMLDGKLHVGVVDVLEGGLPLGMDGQFLSFEDVLLRKQQLNNDAKNVLVLNVRKSGVSSYWTDDFLSRIEIGVVLSKEIEDYFKYLDVFYFSVGHPKLEKYIYDGLAVLFGVLPNVYVRSDGYSELFSSGNSIVIRNVSIACLYGLRLVLAIFLLLVVFHVLFNLWNSIVVRRK